jgi:hypothetical protein
VLEDERGGGEQARQVAAILERKRIALQAELDEMRSLVESVGFQSLAKRAGTFS